MVVSVSDTQLYTNIVNYIESIYNDSLIVWIYNYSLIVWIYNDSKANKKTVNYNEGQ